jgi:hypothetical protein
MGRYKKHHFSAPVITFLAWQIVMQPRFWGVKKAHCFFITLTMSKNII